MSINVARIRSGIYNWIKEELSGTEISPDKIVWLNQDAPRPTRPYVGLDPLSGPSQDGHDESREVTPGFQDVTGNRKMSFTILAYGENSDILMCRLHSSLEKSSTRARLSTYGIALIRQDDVRDITTKLDTRSETRYQFDVMFRVTSSIEDETNFIETVEVEDNINNTTQIVG